MEANWVLKMDIKIFSIAENVDAKCEVSTKSYECKNLTNYKDLYKINWNKLGT